MPPLLLGLKIEPPLQLQPHLPLLEETLVVGSCQLGLKALLCNVLCNALQLVLCFGTAGNIAAS